MYVKQFPVNLNSVSTGTALAAHDQELTAVYAEHQSIATDFAGITAPQLPVTNCRWLDTSTTPPILKRYNGSAWVTEYIDHAVSADNATNAGNAATATKLETARKINGIPFDGSADIDGALSFRNKIINGNFTINQRAVSGTVTLSAGQYGHDRWKAGASGCTYTFSTVANVTTITISAGSLLQIVEGINLQSGTHVVSWQGTAQGKIDAGSYGASGVTGTATGGTNLTVEFNTGTLSNVQLEEGSVATPFEQRPITVEEGLCMRYYEIAVTVLTAIAGTFPIIPYKVVKRASPTLAIIFVDSGTGATLGALPPDGTFGCYQNCNHSVATRAMISVNAEL